MSTSQVENKSLKLLIEKLLGEEDKIETQRKKLLFLISDFVKASIQKLGKAEIIVICTHNSRRSQLGEAWLVAAAQYFELDNIHAYSGGSEATAFNIRMIVALRQVSFHLHADGPRDNPFYVLHALKKATKPHIMYSKVYDHPSNPRKDFIAFMVCNEADQNCPVIGGALHRISLPYLDPKELDDTPMENDAYLEKVYEIGREMLFLIKSVRE